MDQNDSDTQEIIRLRSKILLIARRVKIYTLIPYAILQIIYFVFAILINPNPEKRVCSNGLEIAPLFVIYSSSYSALLLILSDGSSNNSKRINTVTYMVFFSFFIGYCTFVSVHRCDELWKTYIFLLVYAFYEFMLIPLLRFIVTICLIRPKKFILLFIHFYVFNYTFEGFVFRGSDPIEEILKNLEIFKFTNNVLIPYDSKDDRQININEEDATCIVCLDEYVDNDQIRFLRCRHHLHKQCFDEWFKQKASCPICRCEIINQDTADVENPVT